MAWQPIRLSVLALLPHENMAAAKSMAAYRGGNDIIKENKRKHRMA